MFRTRYPEQDNDEPNIEDKLRQKRWFLKLRCNFTLQDSVIDEKVNETVCFNFTNFVKVTKNDWYKKKTLEINFFW